MSSSCSFRITRTAEDLAQTVTAISQRLVKLEQRQQSIEMQLIQSQSEPAEEEFVMLDGIDELLKECQELLGISLPVDNGNDFCSQDDKQDELAA